MTGRLTRSTTRGVPAASAFAIYIAYRAPGDRNSTPPQPGVGSGARGVGCRGLQRVQRRRRGGEAVNHAVDNKNNGIRDDQPVDRG